MTTVARGFWMTQLRVTAHTPHPGEPHPSDCIKYNTWCAPDRMFESMRWETVLRVFEAECARLSFELREMGVPNKDMHWECNHYYVDLSEET